jgi:hypothetical protein
MSLNYSYKHDISYANYNNSNLPWKINSSYIYHNNQRINSSLNLGPINNNLVIESSQNNIILITPQNNKQVVVNNNMTINNDLDISNILKTNFINAKDLCLNGILHTGLLTIIGSINLRGTFTYQGGVTDASASSTRFREVIFDKSMFYDSSINNSDVLTSDFSNMNIFNSYIYNNPIGYDINLQASNVNNYRFNFNNVGILFNYYMLTNLKSNIKLSENYLHYKYPSTVWFKSSKSYREKNRLDYDNIILNINLLPINVTNTKWYITVTFNNLQKSQIRKDIIQKYIYNMLMKQFELLSNQSNNILLKQKMMTHRKHIIYDNINQDFEYLLKRYKYPDIQLVLNLYNYHKMKNL